MHLKLLRMLTWADVPWGGWASQTAMSHFKVAANVGERAWVFRKWGHSLRWGPFSCKRVIGFPEVWVGLVHSVFRQIPYLHWIIHTVLLLSGTRELVQFLAVEHAATSPARIEYALSSRQTDTPDSSCWVAMFSLLIANIMVPFKLLVLFLVLDQRL